MMTPIVWWMLTALAMVDAGPIVQAYLCPYTALGRYFLATQLSVKKNADITPVFGGGVYYAQATQLCNQFGLQFANLTRADLGAVSTLVQTCWPGGAGTVFFDYYENLPVIEFDCNYFDVFAYGIDGDAPTCGTQLPVLCELPLEPVDPFVSTSLANATNTETVTETSTSAYLTTLTTFFLSDVTVTLTDASQALTTLTTTTTRCATITRVFYRPCQCPCDCDDDHESDSNGDCQCNSKSSYECCDPNLKGEQSQDAQEYYDGVLVNRQGVPYIPRRKVQIGPNLAPSQSPQDPAEGKKEKRPKGTRQLGTLCPTSLVNFWLVEQQPPSGATLEEVCQSFGMDLANVTNQALGSIQYVLTQCGVQIHGGAVFNYYYQWQALCAFVTLQGIQLYDNPQSPFVPSCNESQWVLCRQGPPVATTSSIFTGPFGTASVTRTTTVTNQTFTETHYLTDGTTVVTETETETDYVPTLTTSTLTTTTGTQTQSQVTTRSCCCNPVVCMTIDACCQYEYTYAR